MSEKLPETVCPACNKLLNAALDPANRKFRPEPGDPSVCVFCSAVLVFTEGLSLRRMEAKEFKTLPAEVQASIWRMARRPH